MNNLIQRIVNAIIRQEGEPSTALNPGNLKGAPWLQGPVIDAQGFWVPGSRAEGIAGLAHLVALHVAEGNTLWDFIAGAPNVYAGFAPAGAGNNPTVYVADIMVWTGVPSSTVPLWTYLESVVS
jgi:hypothetical protein